LDLFDILEFGGEGRGWRGSAPDELSFRKLKNYNSLRV
jgi:hypothetical protein